MQKNSSSDYYFQFVDLEKTTKIFLFLSLLASTFLGIGANIGGLPQIANLFYGLAILIAVLSFLDYKGYYRFSGFVLSLLIPVAASVMILDGNGLNDPGVLAYGISMLISALLFGRRRLFLFVIINSILVLFSFWIETRGHFLGWITDNAKVASTFDLFIVLTLLAVMSFFIWVTIGIIEKNIMTVIESEGKVTDAYKLTLEGWALALELKDKETEGHSRRVTTLSLKVAKKMGYSDQQLVNMERGALLHDIGKMGIADEILRKEDKLSAYDWSEIKKHPLYAYNMLKNIRYLQDALVIPCFHHEQWDGGGYPEGQAGNEIPEMARIFSLVDNWDALTSDRAYRKAWTKEKAVAYIQSETGKKFDPRLVPLFLEVVSSTE